MSCSDKMSSRKRDPKSKIIWTSSLSRTPSLGGSPGGRLGGPGGSNGAKVGGREAGAPKLPLAEAMSVQQVGRSQLVEKKKGVSNIMVQEIFVETNGFVLIIFGLVRYFSIVFNLSNI